MISKFVTSKCAYFQLVIVLAVVALQYRTIGALSSAIRVDVVNSLRLQNDTGVSLINTQDKRNLEIQMRTTSDETPEERGFTLGISSITILKDLTKSATQKLEVVAANAKLKMSANKQLATDKLFTKLNVDKVESNLLESIQFQKWVKSVNNAYKKSVEEGEMAMVTTLTAHYGDETLTKLLTEAKGVSSTKVLSQKLEEARLTKWLVEGKSVESVFRLLKLDETGANLFRSPRLSSWVSYNVQFQKNPYEAMLLTLKAHLNDEALAKMLTGAKEDSTIAAKLENVELEGWLSSGKTSDDIFKLLNLNDDTGNILRNPAFSTWAAYITKAHTERPYEFMLTKLLTRYDDKDVAKMIYSATLNSNTFTLAEKIENTLHGKWIAERKTADDIFKLLKLEEEGDSVFTSKMWKTWNSYLAKLNKKNPDEQMYLTLTNHFGKEKVKKMVGSAKEMLRTKTITDKLQEEIWRSEGKTADDIFKLLKLDNERNMLFESSMLSAWVSYATKLGKLEKKTDEFIAVSYLEKRFGDLGLARMLGNEKKKHNNLKTVNTLQQMQFKEWMTMKGVNPKRLDKILYSDTSDKAADMRITLDFSDFYKANGGSTYYMYT